ncbi:glutaminyl-peptide cyclotransferase [Acidicapsa ligni]|uniref:glutaminyl-peptide cyclotransferase n=1 Tax=Acidicapsa ligni TaxID=542300 RepID=UPI0021E00B8B|nr:glutaminyl-peptide cyclotransferase [Acidicapsa ligni]
MTAFSVRTLSLSLFRAVALCAILLPACSPAAPVAHYKIVATYPHSTESYTEGLFYRDGLFYEGTGLEGHSAVLAIQPDSGKVLQRRDLPAPYFGEGIIDWGPNLYEWTWQSHICFVYDRFSLRLIKQFAYTGEGWGMTRTAKEIITSDGTDILRFRDPETFKEIRHIAVKDGNKSISQLNELEYIHGEIYANVWHSDLIARISPRDGHVIGWIDFTGILPETEKINGESVLNGIAYDAQRDRIFVTGKQWPRIFEVKIINPSAPLVPAAGKSHTPRP